MIEVQYPELTLASVTPQHVEAYLATLRRTAQSIPELAAEWATMDEAEQLHFRLDLSRAFGLRRLLGAVYQSGRLTSEQVTTLADIDRELLGQAAAVEIVYGSSLRQLAHDLFAWGTPLAEQSGTVHVETTIAALAELAVE